MQHKIHYEVTLGDKIYPCVVGKGGIVSAIDKREGDGGTPEGEYTFKPLIWYREDRINKDALPSNLPQRVIKSKDGWCDDVTKEKYNQYVTLPFDGSHESLMRQDSAYDIFMVIPWNEQCNAGMGSAIFLHIASEELEPTRGCVAFRKNDLLELLQYFTEDTQIVINKTEGITFQGLSMPYRCTL